MIVVGSYGEAPLKAVILGSTPLPAHPPHRGAGAGRARPRGRVSAAPDFRLPSVDGRPLGLAELRARGPVVLVFVSEECPTCGLALRRLAPLAGGLRDAGVTLAAVFEDPPEVAARARARADSGRDARRAGALRGVARVRARSAADGGARRCRRRGGRAAASVGTRGRWRTCSTGPAPRRRRCAAGRDHARAAARQARLRGEEQLRRRHARAAGRARRRDGGDVRARAGPTACRSCRRRGARRGDARRPRPAARARRGASRHG